LYEYFSYRVSLSLLVSFVSGHQSMRATNEYKAAHIARNQRREKRRMDQDTERNGGYPRVEGIGKLIGLSI